MKIVPEILGRQEIADAKIYGFSSSTLCGIVFDNEEEANTVKEILEKLLQEETDDRLGMS